HQESRPACAGRAQGRASQSRHGEWRRAACDAARSAARPGDRTQSQPPTDRAPSRHGLPQTDGNRAPGLGRGAGWAIAGAWGSRRAATISRPSGSLKRKFHRRGLEAKMRCLRLLTASTVTVLASAMPCAAQPAKEPGVREPATVAQTARTKVVIRLTWKVKGEY